MALTCVHIFSVKVSWPESVWNEYSGCVYDSECVGCLKWVYHGLLVCVTSSVSVAWRDIASVAVTWSRVISVAVFIASVCLGLSRWVVG